MGEYTGYVPSVLGPAWGGAAVVFDTPFAQTSRGIYVGSTGNVSATMADGTTLVFVAVPAGTILPIRATVVTSANTTASSMIALW